MSLEKRPSTSKGGTQQNSVQKDPPKVPPSPQPKKK